MRRRVITLWVALGLCLGACTGGGRGAEGSATPKGASAVPPAAGGTTGPASPAVGPLAGLRWPAGTIRTGLLLHDDGIRLWSVTLGGRWTVAWRHPVADVFAIAASPDGERLAMSVRLAASSAADPSFVLYLLDADGSVRVADVSYHRQSIESPIFLRDPTAPAGPDHLYWIRLGQDVSTTTGRFDHQVMVLGPDGPIAVTVPLRYAESVFEITGYPGAATFTLTLFRQNNIPTRLEILQNEDFYGTVDASLTLWGNEEPRANTDVFVGVAWISPVVYVIPVAARQHPGTYRLRLFRVGCEAFGSHVVYRGTGIDWGYDDAPWDIQPGGKDQVLVLGAAGVERLLAGRSGKLYWSAVDLRTGALTRTGAEWEPGPWTFTVARSPVDPPAHRPPCTGHTWS